MVIHFYFVFFRSQDTFQRPSTIIRTINKVIIQVILGAYSIIAGSTQGKQSLSSIKRQKIIFQ